MNRLLVATLVAAVLFCTSAAAQPRRKPPRCEIGGTVGTFAAVSSDGGALVGAAGPRLSINLTDRVGVDLMGDVVAPDESSGLYGIYTIQVRRLIRAGGPSRAAIFLTGGAVGLFEYERVRERRDARPDGSVVVYPARVEAELTRPIGFSGGVGMHRAFARHAAFVAELQAVVPFEPVIFIRGALGLAIPLGGSYESR